MLLGWGIYAFHAREKHGQGLSFHVYIGVDMLTESQCGYIHAYPLCRNHTMIKGFGPTMILGSPQVVSCGTLDLDLGIAAFVKRVAPQISVRDAAVRITSMKLIISIIFA